MDIRAKALPSQYKFLTSTAKYPAFIGGIGSGKTTAGCWRSLIRCQPGESGMIIAPTYPMLRDVVQKTLFEMLHAAGIAFEFFKSEERAIINGCPVLFRSAEHPDRLRGPNLSWAYGDEGALWEEDVWKVILGRLRVGKPSAWITTTPAGFNWVWRYWVENARQGYEAIRASSRENRFLPKEYIEDLVDNYAGEYAKQEIDGEFVAFEGLVYSEFSHLLHIVDPFPIPDGWAKCRGIDYGYTNPFVCLWGAIDPDGRLFIYDEHYRRKTLIADHATAIKTRPGQWQFTVADHDAQDNAEMQSNGVSTRNAQKDVIRGIQKVKARLEKAGDGKPRLFVMRNCVNTIREMGMYRWQEAKGQRNEKEEPMKEMDHACDCLRYMTFELDSKKVYVYAA